MVKSFSDVYSTKALLLLNMVMDTIRVPRVTLSLMVWGSKSHFKTDVTNLYPAKYELGEYICNIRMFLTKNSGYQEMWTRVYIEDIKQFN